MLGSKFFVSSLALLALAVFSGASALVSPVHSVSAVPLRAPQSNLSLQWVYDAYLAHKGVTSDFGSVSFSIPDQDDIEHGDTEVLIYHFGDSGQKVEAPDSGDLGRLEEELEQGIPLSSYVGSSVPSGDYLLIELDSPFDIDSSSYPGFFSVPSSSFVVVSKSDFISSLSSLYLTYENGDSLRSVRSSFVHDTRLVKFYNFTPSSSLQSGQTKDIFIDVDSAYTKEQIISSVRSVDLFGVSVPVSVSSGLDVFDPSRIGVYTLGLKAVDSYGQSATATLVVHICDYKKPVITQSRPLSFVASKGQKLTYADFADYFSVTDNGTAHGSSLDVSFTYDGNAVAPSFSKIFEASDFGPHQIGIRAVDGSMNEATATAVLNVTDGLSPVLTRLDGAPIGAKVTIGLSKVFTMTLTDFTQLFRALDDVDGDVSSSLTGLLESDLKFFDTAHKVGSYTLTIVASDKSGNRVTQAVPVEIVADLPPVFIIADTLVYTDTANPLDVGQINLVVSNGILKGKRLASLSVDATAYVGHENEEGMYHVPYEYTLQDGLKSSHRLFSAGSSKALTGSFDIVVQKSKYGAQASPYKAKGFFVRVADWFRSLGKWFEKLGNWFRGVFTHFDFRCFLDNDDYLLKYPKAVPFGSSSVPEPAVSDQGSSVPFSE